MTKTYEINADLFNEVLPATSKEETRYYLKGVHIEDEDGERLYTATDGHVLFCAKEPIVGDGLEKPLDVYVKSAIKMPKGITNAFMTVVDDDTVIFKGCVDKTVGDIIDCNYPDWRRVVEFDDSKKVPAHEYALFNPDYMKKAIKFTKAVSSSRPFMADCKSPAQWEEHSDDCHKICVVMPMRFE